MFRFEVALYAAEYGPPPAIAYASSALATKDPTLFGVTEIKRSSPMHMRLTHEM